MFEDTFKSADKFYFSGTLHIDLNVIKKIEPYPTLDYTYTVPPIDSTIILHIDNPRPLPDGLFFLCSSKLLKFIKIVSNLSGGIPHPKS
jgi:hypothetical protein